MDSLFEKTIAADEFVLVDFYADWCEPCKWVEPILGDIKNHFEDRLSVAKINIDLHTDVSRTMHIMSVPTLVLFSQGKEVWRIRGFDSANAMIGEIAKHVK